MKASQNALKSSLRVRFGHSAACLALALVGLGSPALAQDGGQPPAEDLGGWLEEGSDPLTPAPEPATGPVSEDQLTPAEQRKRGRVIDRNYADAQRTYGEILSKDPSGPLDRRIANNERIVKEFRGRIAGATKERRQAQVDLYNRTFFLKQQLDKKQITPDVYERLIREEEDKFQRAEATYKVNVVAWQKEVDEALQRLDQLRSQRRLLDAQKPRRQQPRRQRGGGEAGEGGGPQGSQLVGNLRSRLQRLASFNRRHTLDMVHPRTLGSAAASAPLVEDE